MKASQKVEIKAILLFAAAILFFVSFVSFTPQDLAFYTSHPNAAPHNLIRTFGAYVGALFLFFIGWIRYLVPLLMILWAIKLFRDKELDLRIVHIIGITVLLVCLSSLVALFASADEVRQFALAGLIGSLLFNITAEYFGKLGAFIIFLSLVLLSLGLVFNVLYSQIFLSLRALFKRLSKFLPKPRKVVFNLKERKPKILPKILPPRISITKPVPPQPVPPRRWDKGIVKPKEEVLSAGVREGYTLPPLDLLDSPVPIEKRKIKEDLTALSRILEETLSDFGISAKVTNVERGPAITRYELEPAPGIKLNRISSLADDIALTMKAQSVRILAPIPGKGRVGVEVPNIESAFVNLKEILETEEFQGFPEKLGLALGKDISGKSVVADLGEMPHLLIAGTTGSGKTVCVNSLILSLLFRATPEEVKFLMVDPKRVELAPYNNLPHLLCPVVTEAKKVTAALTWLVSEMERRYELFAEEGKRDIETYNQEREEKIPYIVVIVDELADLMALTSHQLESVIGRLAQLSRAVGIHLILATQRPSVNVITGVIKANFPARISFKVASKVDSRTVLDANGADKLKGCGDMLFLKPQESRLIRAQGCLTTEKEIERVVDFIKKQRSNSVYDEEILKKKIHSALSAQEKDEFYDEAVRLIIETGQASVSILQRRMRLGYTRAARIIDAMEEEGLVGPFEGSKPRRILVDREEWLKINSNIKDQNAK